ncbi:MAG: hypothetical protein IJ282_07885 [Lachnospiraceae bacterium]|nr:hypothetical protein [Lachnospiraceae bacterium]
MRRMIKASMEANQYIDTLLGQCAQMTFTADEVLDLLNTIEELQGLEIFYNTEPRGNFVFTIGDCEYLMVGKTKE